MQNKNFFKNQKFPMNLQLFAEPGAGEGASGAGGEKATGNDNGQDENALDKKLSYEEILEKLAQAETKATNAAAEAEKWKTANDKSSSEAANYKKQLTAKMTAEEQLDAAKKEQEAVKDALIAEYQRKEKVRDCTEFLMDSSIGMDKKTAKEFAQKFVEGNFDDAMPILEKHIKAIKDTAYQQALSDRPDPKAGNGEPEGNLSAMTMAAAYARRQNGVNMDILNKY